MVRRINKTAATQKQEETMVPTKDDEGFYYRGQHVELKEYMRVIDFGKADVFFDPLELYCVEFLDEYRSETNEEEPWIVAKRFDLLKLRFKNGKVIKFESHVHDYTEGSYLREHSTGEEGYRLLYSELLTAFNIYKQIKQ